MLTVALRTPDFTGVALHYSEFPWQRVYEILENPHPRLRIELCRDALLTGHEEFDQLSYRQIAEVVNLYFKVRGYETDVADVKETLTE
ncbi:MAG TPA: hypothetical protein VK149_04130 [Sideroxyarcus sp.]|nr:hypothetical protein [Sideroxyarcus sp.]